jgi:hypothetical protein
MHFHLLLNTKKSENNSDILIPFSLFKQSMNKLISILYYIYLDKNSVSQSSIHTSKSSFLSNVAKQCESPVSTEQEKSSIPNTPLLLTYAQLHQLPPPSRVRRPTYAHACIDPILNDKRNSISVVNSKVFFTSRPSDSSTTTISLLPTKDNYEIVNDNFVRLKTPQLRRLSVSEKYINEAKKLYFNPDCRIFVPRVAIGQVF